MTKRLPRFDSHVSAFQDFKAGQAAQEAAAQERAANLPFCFTLKASDVYATIYDSAHDAARPVGTITRPRLFGEARAKLWTVSATDGVNVWQSALRPSAMQATRALIRYQAAKEEEARAAALSADLDAAGLSDGGRAYALECLAAGGNLADSIAAAKAAESRLADLDAESAEGFDGMATGRDWTRKAAPRPFDPAPADIYGPGEETPADLKARRAAFFAGIALPRIVPALECPLAPRRPALAQLAALNAGAF